MSFEIAKQEIRTGKKLYEISDGQRIEPEIVLPDYCKEIKKLLKCTFVPGIHSVNRSGERVTAKGTGVIRVLYLGEDDTVDVFDKSCDLASSVQMKDMPEDAVITAKQNVDFLNCRVTGQRKLSVSIGISTVFTCLCTRCEEIIGKPVQSELQTRHEKHLCETFYGFCEKTFDMSETVVLNSEHPSVGKIVSTDSFCKVESCKISSGKLLVKGEVIIDIHCLEENGVNRFHRVSHSMPVSQIIDIGDSDGDRSADVTLKVTQLMCSLKSDSSGKNRLVELSLRVSALVSLSAKKEIETVADCYCTGYEIETEYAPSEQLCPVRVIDESAHASGVVEFSDKVREILSVRCLEIAKDVDFSDEKAEISCSATLGIVHTDEKGIPAYCEKNLGFSFDFSVGKKCADPFGFFTVEPLSVEASVSEDKAEVSLDYKVKGRVYCRIPGRILKKLKVCEDKPLADDGAALTLYFAQKGESLWEIAKSHNTTAELIRSENGLENASVTQEGMLLIPCV
ncbi:MAG: DUF3794 domain-containing protein [Clostridia bacterium]|nr:DUF3794 domain-containing protein [Clostridia bacterium]